MHIVVFGANGRVGRKLVVRLLNEGHEITAFVYRSSEMSEQTRLSIRRGDVHVRSDVENALSGADAVISVLGSWRTKSKDILSAGMQNIIPAMEHSGIKRIVSLTGAGSFDEGDQLRLIDRLNHALLRVFAPRILRDGEAHIALLRASSLDWTVVRSPIMKEKSKKGFELVNNPPPPWATIDRDDVVNAITYLVSRNEFTKSAPFIVRK